MLSLSVVRLAVGGEGRKDMALKMRSQEFIDVHRKQPS